MYNIRMKFSDYIKFSFFHRLLSASFFGILIGLFFLLSGFYVTQIKIETSGNNVDAYIVKKFLFSPFNKFDLVIKNVKQAKGYKLGIEPLKHQKIKIRYEKEEPAMFSRLESFKCKDTEGNIIEMDF